MPGADGAPSSEAPPISDPDPPPGLPDSATRWLTLTRETLPALAATRCWPVRADHCFQRILLDNACGGRWYDVITARPAYRHAPPETLARAIALGDAVIAGTEDLHALNRRSLAWRGKAPALPK